MTEEPLLDTGFKVGIFQRIWWMLWMYKLTWILRCIELKHKKSRFKYCRKGYHKLRSSFVSWSTAGKRMQTVRFLLCAHCNYMWFASKRDEKRYQKYDAAFYGSTKETFSAYLKSPRARS